MQPLSVPQIRALFAEACEEDLPRLVRRYRRDTRAAVIALVESAERRHARATAENVRLESLATVERELSGRGLRIIAGVDEVGRGALAGPVTAGACVLPLDAMFRGLNDSKRLTALQRERLDAQIRAAAVGVAIGHASPEEIDALGIAGATVLAMRRALEGLALDIDHVVVDGRPVDLGRPSTAIVRGDSTVRAIAAAAIAAKIARDALMTEMDARYPGYRLAENKGYGSADHLRAIAELGPSPIHRLSFTPCSQAALF